MEALVKRNIQISHHVIPPVCLQMPPATVCVQPIVSQIRLFTTVSKSLSSSQYVMYWNKHTVQANVRIYYGGGVNQGVPMSHVDYKKWLCRPVKFKKTSCRYADFKNVLCRMSLRHKQGCATISI